MEQKNIPIGKHDFANLITGNYYFVDKSLFIKELLDSGAAVTLLPRPRRFGKTVNMSMLRYFFEKSDISNRHLFNGLKIEQYPTCMAKQGQYPVIFLTFKDVKDPDWSSCQTSIKKLIAEEFTRHADLLTSGKLTPFQQKKFIEVTEMAAEDIFYTAALKDLSAYLHRAYGKRPLILIDEYDAPIHTAVEYGYYDKIVNFMRIFLSGGLKDNSNLEFSVLTGILRIAKESIFSGLNNLRVCTFLQEAYADKFGLLEHEVEKILLYYSIPKKLSDVQNWYDGYQSGELKIYNPWSILNMIDNKGLMKPYWVNTSGNALLKQIISDSDPHLKEDLEQLVRGIPITKELDENVVMTELLTNERATWSLLLMSGYLTFENYRPQEQEYLPWVADLKIPNTEIETIFNAQILSWFKSGNSGQRYQSMLQNLVDNKIELFQTEFEEFTKQTLSSFDTGEDNPEKFYHGFVLGMLASLRATHEVVSNRESGYGRYDVSIFPHDTTKPGIIIEFKVVNKRKKETLETCAQDALKQIEDREYEAVMRARGITNMVKLGISFEGKKNLVLVG